VSLKNNDNNGSVMKLGIELLNCYDDVFSAHSVHDMKLRRLNRDPPSNMDTHTNPIEANLSCYLRNS
jgi:hypothetical protein